MKTPTIYDIKYDTQEKAPYYFNHGTLKFFGQTMKSFHVQQSPAGRVFIFAPSYWDRRLMGYTFHEYCNHDLINVRDDEGNLFSHTFSLPAMELAAIHTYINTH